MPDQRRLRILGWCVLAACFLLGFFHRFAPATFAEIIATDLDASSAALGALFSWHFWIYTAAQIPAGLLVDRYGIKWCVFGGTLVTACGSFVLATAHNLGTASIGPALTGAGLSTVFVGIMKFNAVWFRAENYGLVTGLTMLLATVGAIIAGSPMALLLEHYDWRALFAVVALTGVLLSFCVALLVKDRAPDTAPPTGASTSMLEGLSTALRQKALWPLLLATLGTNGTFYAFAGLWGVPILTDSRGVDNTIAVWYVTAAMVTYCGGCLAIGILSDRARRRKPFIVGTSVLAVVGWASLAVLPWQPGWQGFALYIVVGAAASQVTVSFAALKESVPASIAATALAILNAGVFAASAAIQPLLGLSLDLGMGWHWALALMVVASLLGLAASCKSQETRCTSIPPASTVSGVGN